MPPYCGGQVALGSASCRLRKAPCSPSGKALGKPLERLFAFDGVCLGNWLEDSGTCGAWDYFDGYAPILVCADCGVDGYGALLADIQHHPNSVVWSHFQNLNHPEWDYSGFGPFVFSPA